MCGLTGVALHPKSDKITRFLVATVLDDLILRTEHRGTHATGLASLTSRGVVTVKRAEKATAFVKRAAYREALDRVAEGDANITLAHTRYATHGAHHIDENAHPFTYGKVTGAHNGIITNWRALEAQMRRAKRPEAARGFSVDSEAAIALLNITKKPEVALAQLEGYFALTWMRGSALYIARTDAPMTVAYSPSLRAMFWNSERQAVEKALAGAGITDATYYDPTAGKVYRYEPRMFDENGSNVEHVGEFEFTRAERGVNFARPTIGAGVRTSASTAVTTPRTPMQGDPLRMPLGRDYSMPEMMRRINLLGERLLDTEARLRVMTVRADALSVRVAKLERESPYLETVDEGVREHAAQLALFVSARSAAADAETFASEGGTCSVCGFIGDRRTPLLPTESGEMAHSGCLALEAATA